MAWDPHALMREVWQQNLPVFRLRMERLDNLVLAAAAGHLTEAQRSDAEGVAHQLAGSLGMFGFPEGTKASRELEALLASGTNVDTHHCHRLVTQLHDMLGF